jgi:signal peptidase I
MQLAEERDVAKRDLTAEVIRRFGEGRLKVTGTSMLPSVWPGDVLTVRRRSASELPIGSIVLCYRSQAYVAHRLVRKCDRDLITRGDSLSFDDPSFRPEEVLGAVVSIVRNGRQVTLTPAWWHRICSLMVRHSELCTRVLLRMRRMPSLSWGRR